MSRRRALQWLIGALTVFLVFAVVNHRKARLDRQRWVCTGQLLDIEGAKEQFALERNGEAPTRPDDLVPTYLKAWPRCPAGGLYTMGDMQTPAACSVEAHNPAW